MAPSDGQIIRKLQLLAGWPASVAYHCRRQKTSFLVDVDWRSDGDHRVEAFDVLVAHTHAAVTDGLPDCLGMVRAVDSVPIAKLEAAGAENAHVSTRGGAVRRHNDVSIDDDLLAFNAPS